MATHVALRRATSLLILPKHVSESQKFLIHAPLLTGGEAPDGP